MHIKFLSSKQYSRTVFWGVLLSALIVGIAATLARASYNVTAALTEKPDVAIYMLLKDQNLGETTVLRDGRDQRDYLAQTKTGPKLVRLKRGPNQWFVEFEEDLHQ